ncbi:MAG TPA: CDP-alcohol phosphatidyltransferase family protein [Polyangiaceae bacterium]|jgi:CDP-diacylglycerol--glycerol-3-phosphate 3-phosphatidyltransferase|nr:MAG: CDP-diacylglycerol--inositol 3-phosphatidyltransferase [Deltaproteobacteria bacterium ADurb.Bin207]HOT08812.1 CDP-alcohol phosphatidyltransferase family protein [Polyangiaceae bacterium]HPY17416.1 CDP-alcohol phosphatidyltransferase family protein [Polyangiaceae bacterium]
MTLSSLGIAHLYRYSVGKAAIHMDGTFNQSAATSLIVVISVAAFFLTAVSGYAVRSLLVGRRHDEKLQRLGGTMLLGAWFMEAVYWAIRAPGKLFARLGVKPDTLTIISLLLTLAAAPIAAVGHFSTAGLLFLVGSAFDALDGMVARETGAVKKSGAMLDSVFDRYSDAAPMIGLAIFYRFSVWQMLLPLVALMGSQLVSYVRAKAEAMDLSLPSTLMRRHERVAYISGALILAPLLSPVLGNPWGAVHPATLTIILIVALVSNLVAVQLLIAARKLLDAKERG